MSTTPRGSKSEKMGCTIMSVAGLIVAIVTLILALLNYLFPFTPVRTSPAESLIDSNTSQTEQGLANPLAEEDGTEWNVTFYSDKNLGEPVLLRSTIDGARNGLRVDWGLNSPHEAIPPDFFSALFSTSHNFLMGRYCFGIEDLDDGARLLIDGQEVRDYWWGYTPGAVYRTLVTLDEGPHTITLEYFEEFENAGFHLFWYENGGAECVTTGHPGIQ
jgi:hypothetical protein